MGVAPPSQVHILPSTNEGGAYGALVIWSWAQRPTSAPEVASWGEKVMGRSVQKGPTWQSMVLVPL